MSASVYTPDEDRAHCLTHAIGIVASLIAIPWLVAAARAGGDGWRLLGGVAFGVTALLMFTTSVLYHSAKAPSTRRRLRQLDHSAIYLLIAGTYTPLMLGVIKGQLGWTMTIIIWCRALAGIAFKVTPLGFRFNRVPGLPEILAPLTEDADMRAGIDALSPGLTGKFKNLALRATLVKEDLYQQLIGPPWHAGGKLDGSRDCS